MTGLTIVWNTYRSMVWIGRLIKIRFMTCKAHGRGAAVAIGMAPIAIRRSMCPGQRKI